MTEVEPAPSSNIDISPAKDTERVHEKVTVIDEEKVTVAENQKDTVIGPVGSETDEAHTGQDNNTVSGPPPEGLSKNQLKKWKAKERWYEHRKQKREEERARRKAKRQLLRESGEGESLKRFRGKTMEQSSCKVRVAIDLSFDELMSFKDRNRTVQQLNWCYAMNRRIPEPMQLYYVGFSGPSRQIFDNVETNRNQDVHIRSEPLNEVFEKENIVYLSAESDNILDKLEDTSVYVIGGLVDHNSQKGYCHQLAVERGYRHARLPLEEHIDMKTRKVLTINHVFEILAKYSATSDWQQAIFTVMPARKGAEPKKDEDVEAQITEDKPESNDQE